MHIHRLLAIAVLLLAGLAMPLLAKEEQLGAKDEMEKRFGAMRDRKNAWLTGTAKVTKSDADDLDFLAKWYVYRVTWVNARVDAKVMADVIDRFDKEFIKDAINPNYKDNKDFVTQFGKHAAKRWKEVLDLEFDDNKLACVNAAVMLPMLAKLKHEDVGDLLADLIADPKKHDAIKVYALRALREFFPVSAFDPADGGQKGPEAKHQRVLKRVNALIEFLDRKWPKTSDKLEEDAQRYIRREAIMTLAQVGVPALKAQEKPAALEGAVAYGLIRVLIKDLPGPELSLYERSEAAIGLANLKFKDSLYEPDVSLYVLAKFGVDFIEKYRNEQGNIRLVLEKKERMPPILPWKVQAERLKAGLAHLAKESAATPAAEKAKRLSDKGGGLLASVAAYEAMNSSADIENRVAELRPKSGALFRKIAGPEIKLEE